MKLLSKEEVSEGDITTDEESRDEAPPKRKRTDSELFSSIFNMVAAFKIRP